MDQIAVLIPCYNEALTITKVIHDFRAALPTAKIYVYDNNSTDGTARLAEAAGAIVRFETQQGKGAVVRRMFRDIDARAYLLVDGDATYPAEEATALLQPILQGQADMVIGDRLSATYFTENKRPFHNMGNSLVRHLINTLFASDIKDMMTGYRALSYALVKTYPALANGFEIETEMTIHCLDKKLQLQSRPIAYQDRPQGSESKLHTYRDGYLVLKTIVRLFKDYKPLLFFGGLALLLSTLGFLLVSPVLYAYAQTGLVERFPTLIVAGFFLAGAMMSFLAGIILDVEAKNERVNFERFFKQAQTLRQLREGQEVREHDQGQI